jgi:hypothetical protein
MNPALAKKMSSFFSRGDMGRGLEISDSGFGILVMKTPDVGKFVGQGWDSAAGTPPL